MKTNKLEKRNLSMKIDWDKVYPKQSSPDFLERVHQNWQNLNGGFNKKDNDLLRLYHKFKPVRGKINKETIFYLWLFLCIYRPWEKGWQIIFSERRDNGNIWNKIYSVTDQLKKDFPLGPEVRTLRKHTRRKDFKFIITSLAVNPDIFIGITKIFEKIAEGFNRSFTIKQIDYNNLKLNFKFANYIRSQRHVKKRDLMRKLGINKRDCDLLLDEAVSQNFIKLKKFSHNSIWIIYINSRKGNK
jgi:hypothetical protein